MLIAFSGPSGVGKSFLTNTLAKELGFHRVRILTTRKPRKSETSADKEFVSIKDVEKLRKGGEFFYDFEFLGNTYAYRNSDILDDRNSVFEVPQEVVSDWKKLYPEIKLIYLMPKKISDIEKKIRERESDPEVVKKRVGQIKKSVQEFKSDKQLQDMFDFAIKTDYTRETTDIVLRIVRKLLGQEEKTFFGLDENFDEIIAGALPDKKIVNINQISTGWTNIVFEVETSAGNYFFRFPRDDFWTRTIVKDVEFANFIHGKTSFDTVKLELHFDNSRPYSIHKKIPGETLASKMENLPTEKIDNVSRQIAQFMYELHQIDFDSGVFSTKNIDFRLTGFLDELIELHLSDTDKEFWNLRENSKKDHSCLVHGDLNSSNIILDENDDLAAVIDFGFGGFGNKYFDIARIIGRCPENFRDSIVRHYNNFSDKQIDEENLDEEISIWTDIDAGYINYMRRIGIYE